MRRATAPRPHNRDGIWYLVRRVPKAYAHLDARKVARLSTEIRVADDPRAVRAQVAVETLDRELHAYWRGLADGASSEARRRFEAAQRRARALHLDYRTAGELAAGSIEEIVRRVQLIVDHKAIDDEAEVAAIAGGEQRPALRLRNLTAEWEAINKTALLSHSPGQRRKWGHKYARAVRELEKVVQGNPELTALTRQDAINFREHWQARVLAEGIDIGTANKSIGHIHTMLAAVDLLNRTAVAPLFEGIRLKGEKKKRRAAYSASYVQQQILRPGALDGLNEEARAIVWIVADTGMRPVEVANLSNRTERTIFLDAKIPFVRVLPSDRVLKTDDSERDIPLVGSALAAMRLFPNGFARYHDNEASLSAAVNKYLAEHGLRPTPQHSAYSLRHCFEDRLTAVEAPEKLIASLMGHKFHREKYGKGPSLAQKARWMRRIAFTPPAHFGPPAADA